MRRSPALLLLCLLAPLAAAVCRPTAVPAAAESAPVTNLTSPEATVRSFVLAINKLDAGGADCVMGAEVDQDLKTWLQIARGSKETLRITIVEIKTQPAGETAAAEVTEDLESGGQISRFTETVTLRKNGNDWKIVPPTAAELDALAKPGEKNPFALSTLAAIYSHPKKFTQVVTGSERLTVCRSHLKQLATATLIFLQDSDDKFTMKADDIKPALGPYVRDQDCFRCPGDAGVTYALNPKLQGKRMQAVHRPAQTVMLYEGKKGVLTFRHNGHAVVAFANGAVKSVTAAEAKTLLWTP